MKKFLILFFAAVGIFLVPRFSFAAQRVVYWPGNWANQGSVGMAIGIDGAVGNLLATTTFWANIDPGGNNAIRIHTGCPYPALSNLGSYGSGNSCSGADAYYSSIGSLFSVVGSSTVNLPGGYGTTTVYEYSAYLNHAMTSSTLIAFVPLSTPQSVTFLGGTTAILGQSVYGNCVAGSTTCGSIASIDLTIGGTSYLPPPDNPTISFRYPTGDTGLFSNWLLHATNLNASGSYEARVTWIATLPGGTTIAPITNLVGDLNFQYPDWYPVIARTPWNYDFATDVTIRAEADLLSSQDPNNPTADLAFPIVIASTTETFTLQSIPNSSPSSTLSTGGIVILTNQDTSGTITTSTIGGFADAGVLNLASSTCAAPEDWTDIGGGITYGFCQTINFLFVPGAAGTDKLNSTITKIEQTPPLSWFFGINSQIANIANSSSTSAGGIIIPNVLDSLTGSKSTITLLPADPTTNSFLGATQHDGSSIINTAWNLILTFCVLLLMLIFYRIVIL